MKSRAAFLYTVYMFKIWYQSIVNFSVYPLLQRASVLRTLLFGLYLFVVGLLVFNLYAGWQIHRQLPTFVQQLPALVFDKGTLVSPEKPLTIAVPSTAYSIRVDAKADSAPTTQQFADEKWLAFIGTNQLYMPGVTGVQKHTLPAQLDGPIADILQPHLPQIRSILHVIAFITAFLILGMFFLFSYLLAVSVLFFWRGIRQRAVPMGTIFKWAVFLQGPALVVWMIHLFIGVPLFVFALFILFNIYAQQIFNTLRAERGDHAA